AKDDEVLQTSGDEDLTDVEKPEIAGAKISPTFGITFELGAERRLGFRRSSPVATRDARPRHPDLADATVRAMRARRRIGHDDVLAGEARASSDEDARVVRTHGFARKPLFESGRIEHRTTRQCVALATADDQRRLGKPVTRVERTSAEPGRPERPL